MNSHAFCTLFAAHTIQEGLLSGTFSQLFSYVSAFSTLGSIRAIVHKQDASFSATNSSFE